MSRLLLPTVVVIASLASACEGIELYEVTRTPVVECEIRPNGEFCGDVGSPIVQVWAVELRETHTFLHFDEETWVADGIEGERTVTKIDQATRDPGPCTTTLSRKLDFVENGESITGSLEVATRVEGPEACGETPRGTRSVISVTGPRTNSI